MRNSYAHTGGSAARSAEPNTAHGARTSLAADMCRGCMAAAYPCEWSREHRRRSSGTPRQRQQESGSRGTACTCSTAGYKRNCQAAMRAHHLPTSTRLQQMQRSSGSVALDPHVQVADIKAILLDQQLTSVNGGFEVCAIRIRCLITKPLPDNEQDMDRKMMWAQVRVLSKAWVMRMHAWCEMKMVGYVATNCAVYRSRTTITLSRPLAPSGSEPAVTVASASVSCRNVS